MGRYIARRLAQGARGHLRRDGVRVRHHPDRSATREVHAAALGHGGAARRRAAQRSGSTTASSSSSSHFLGDLVRLDLGESTYVRGTPALDGRVRLPAADAAARRRWACSIAVVLSIPLGVIASRKPGRHHRPRAHHAQPDRAVDAAVLPRLHPADHVHRAAAMVRDRARARGHEPRPAGDLPGAAGHRPAGDGGALVDDRRAQHPVRQGRQGEGPEPAPDPRRARPQATPASRTSRCSAGRSSVPSPATRSSSSRCSTGPASASWPRPRSRTRTSS